MTDNIRNNSKILVCMLSGVMTTADDVELTDALTTDCIEDEEVEVAKSDLFDNSDDA